jgi:hypothetical protein
VNTAEKITVLETLLVRVQQRAAQPRVARALQEAPAAAEVAVVEPAPIAALAEVAPPASAAVPTPAVEVSLELDTPSVAAPVAEAPPAPKSAPVPAPTAAVATKTTSGSYVAKGGMSEELPDFDLEEEEEAEGDEEIVIEQEASAPAVDDESEAEEFAIPLRPSVQMRAIVAPMPIEVEQDNAELELDRTPLASALPASSESAMAAQPRRIPSATVPAVHNESNLDLDIEVSPASLAPAAVSAPEFKAPLTSLDDLPEPTAVIAAIDLPEPPVEERLPEPEAVIPLVAAVKMPPPVAPPVAVVPAPTAAIEAEKPALALAPVEPASASEPIEHVAASLPAADVVSVVSDVAAPAPPATFGALLRRSLSLRVK